MAERKPRAFAAMRDDRVIDMATRRFGRVFTSKAAAVEALSRLPIAEQHALPKRADPGRPSRPAAYNNTRVLDAMRGGAAKAPDALKLVDAVYEKPHAVMRLAKATTNIDAKSPSQALTLLRKFGGTDMRKAADGAYKEIAHLSRGRIAPWPGAKPNASWPNNGDEVRPSIKPARLDGAAREGVKRGLDPKKIIAEMAGRDGLISNSRRASSVSVSDLRGAQDYVDSRKVESLAAKLKSGRVHPSSLPPVTVANVKGQMVLLDGHHRASAARIAGVPALKANVIDYKNAANAGWSDAARAASVKVRKADLLRTYEKATGVPASPRATRAWLSTEIAAANSRARANRVAAGVQVAALATTAIGTYRRKRAEQMALPGGGSMAGTTVDRVVAAGSAAIATAPGVALTMLQGAANHASHQYISLPFGLTYQNPLRHVAAGVTKVAGRAVLPALALYSMHRGALEDSSAIRGAGRGLVRALDLSAIVLDKGLGERTFDAVAGKDGPLPTPGVWDHVTGKANSPPFVREPNGYAKFIDSLTRKVMPGAAKGQAYLDPAARPPMALPAPAAPAAPAPAAGGRLERQSYVTQDGRTVQATAGMIRRYEAQKAA